LTYLARKSLNAQVIVEQSTKQIQNLETSLQQEINASQSLNSKVKNLQQSNMDSEWRLQEKIAHLNTILNREKDYSSGYTRTSIATKELKVESAASTTSNKENHANFNQFSDIDSVGCTTTPRKGLGIRK
jgi:hypothetical protein